MVHLASYSMAPDEAMACRAAVVTETTVNPQADPTVGLFVMAPTGGHVVRGVSCDLRFARDSGWLSGGPAL